MAEKSNEEKAPEELTFYEKMENGCGDLYISVDETTRIIKILADLLVDPQREVSVIQVGGYRLTAERDAFQEDGIHLTREKIK